MVMPVSDLIDLARGVVCPPGVGSRRLGAPAGARSRAATVLWGICRHCNMACANCGAAATTRRSAQDLTSDEVVRILGELAGAGVRKVVWGGGEPLLRDDLEELVAAARARGIVSHLSSNGVLLASRARSLAEAGLGYVAVSLDGPRERNDAQRRVAGGFDMAVRGLQAARVAGLQTGIRMTISRTNRRELGAMLDVAAHVDVDRFELAPRCCAGRAPRVAGDELDGSDSREVLLQLFERVASSNRPLPRVVAKAGDAAGPLLVGWVAARFGAAAADRVEAVLDRGGEAQAERVIAIDHRGRVHRDRPQSVVLADLRRVSLAKALASPSRSARRPVAAGNATSSRPGPEAALPPHP